MASSKRRYSWVVDRRYPVEPDFPGHLDRLVIVAGHAIFLGNEPKQPENEANWSLMPFQRNEISTYVAHIRLAVASAAADPSTLLVFSGGQTRADAGPRSEGQGYWNVADIYDWWGAPAVARRATTEEFARDSYENLLFAICRFREWTGSYPSRISVVSWPFKAARFEIHRAALRIPESIFEFLGHGRPSDPIAAESGEAKVLHAFARDPHGIQMSDKRNQRNPFNRCNPYATNCPELRPFLRRPECVDFTFPWERVL